MSFLVEYWCSVLDKWSYSSRGAEKRWQSRQKHVCWFWMRVLVTDRAQEDCSCCLKAERAWGNVLGFKNEHSVRVGDQQITIVYSSCSAEIQTKVWSSWAAFLQGCYLEMWVTLETEGLSLQEGCSESLAVLQERHFAIYQVVRISTGWDQCNLEYQVAC